MGDSGGGAGRGTKREEPRASVQQAHIGTEPREDDSDLVQGKMLKLCENPFLLSLRTHHLNVVPYRHIHGYTLCRLLCSKLTTSS